MFDITKQGLLDPWALPVHPWYGIRKVWPSCLRSLRLCVWTISIDVKLVPRFLFSTLKQTMMQGDWNRFAPPVQRSYGIWVDEWSDQPLVPALFFRHYGKRLSQEPPNRIFMSFQFLGTLVRLAQLKTVVNLMSMEMTTLPTVSDNPVLSLSSCLI